MPAYLVERYLPRSRAGDVAAEARRARDAAASLAGEGCAVRYLRTTVLPDDETCFHLFEADSLDVVSHLCRRAGLQHARIARAFEP